MMIHRHRDSWTKTNRVREVQYSFCHPNPVSSATKGLSSITLSLALSVSHTLLMRSIILNIIAIKSCSYPLVCKDQPI